MTDSSTRTVRRGHRSGRLDHGGGRAAPPAGPVGTTVGSGSANGSPSRAARSRATPAMHQASGRFPSTVMSKTVSGAIPSASIDRRPGLGALGAGQHEQPFAVVGEAELPSRAQHPVGDDPLHLAATDLDPAGQHGADRGQRHEVADPEVEGPADDLERLAVARGRRRPAGSGRPPRWPPPPGPGRPRCRSRPSPTRSTPSTMRPRSSSARRRARRRRRRWGRTPSARTTGRARCSSELPEEPEVVLDEGPHVGDLVAHHGAPVDAEPEREARPLARGRSPTASNTAGSTMPHPPSSTHPVPEQVRHPAAEADRAGDVVLGRGLGEGEVGRPQPRVHVGPK